MTRTPLALLNLLHDRLRTLVAVAGVTFAVLLLFVQLGFFQAIWNTATLVHGALDYDLALISGEYMDLFRARSFPRERLEAARGWPGVTAVRPLWVGVNLWKNADPDAHGKRRAILVLGVEPNDPPFRGNAELTPDRVAAVARPHAVLMDRRSSREFGARIDVGTETHLALAPVQVQGRYTLGAGFGADGMVIVSPATYAAAFGPRATARVNFGLIKVRGGPAAAAALAEQVRGTLPADVRLLTRAELEGQERTTWVWKRSLGKIFLMGLILAFVVGVVFVYQVIASDIGNKLGEYATLKAMGYPAGYLNGVVLGQAIMLALVSYVPGVLGAAGLYALMRRAVNLPAELTWPTAAGVLAAAVAMCGLSAVLAVRKVRAADPADLF